MSEIVTGVLSLPDDLFWSENPLSRAQHNQVRLEAADRIMNLEAEKRELLQALQHLAHNARASGAEMGMALDVANEAIARCKP